MEDTWGNPYEVAEQLHKPEPQRDGYVTIFGRRIRGWAACCRCGWVGVHRGTYHDAEDDCLAHRLAEVNDG